MTTDKTGKQLYESWAHQQPKRHTLPRWDDLAASTQVHWNKQAIYGEPASSPAMNAASPTKSYRKADINAEIAHAFLYTENGPIGLMLLQEQGSVTTDAEQLQAHRAAFDRKMADPLHRALAERASGATSGEATPNFCLLIDELLMSWISIKAQGNSPEKAERRINARSALESAIAALAAKAEQSNSAGSDCSEPPERTALEAIFNHLDPHRDAVLWGIASDALNFGRAPVAERAVAPASVPEGDADELHFNAQRLRNVAKLVGLESSVPQDDESLDGARGAVLGMIAAKLRKGAAPEVAQPAAQGESIEGKGVSA